MSEYILTADGELYHYGVKGMKWGRRKAQAYTNKARTARESAKEWKEIGKYKSEKLMAAGKTKKAAKVEAKYKENARKDLNDAKAYETKAKTYEKKVKVNEAQVNISKSRTTGSKIAMNLWAGPFANRTYNAARSAGATKEGAFIVTTLTAFGGPLAHIAVAELYTNAAANGNTVKKYK